MENAVPKDLAGCHVVEVGLRQAWPFVTFANAESGTEVRPYIDTDYAVAPVHPTWGDQDDEQLRDALFALNMLRVTDASADSDAVLTIGFNGGEVLKVSGTGNRLTSNDVWSLVKQPS